MSLTTLVWRGWHSTIRTRHAAPAYLKDNWKDGKLAVSRSYYITGFTTYGKTLSEHDKEAQRLHTLAFRPSAMDFGRNRARV